MTTLLGSAEQREEDLAVGVGAHGVRDLGGEQADLLDDRLERGDEREHDPAAGVGLELAGATGRRAAQPLEQLRGRLAPAVVVAGEELRRGASRPARARRCGVG